MSARQAFVPRPPSRVPSSEPRPHLADTGTRDADNDHDMFVNGNGNGKARSITAFLGQRRATGTDNVSQDTGPAQPPGLVRANTNTNRRHFESILRPEMTPMSIIPYPTTTTPLGAGAKQPGIGQTPRKTTGQGTFEFQTPITPMSVPRGLKKGFGIFPESRDGEAISDGNAIGFTGPEGEAGVRVGTGAGGYMRVFEGLGGGGSIGGSQLNPEHNIAAPVPGYVLGGLGENTDDDGHEIDGIFARPSRSSLGAMSEAEAGMGNNDLRRSHGGTKRGTRYHGDADESGMYTDDGHQTQGSAKRMRRVEQDPDEYHPISSPHSLPTPRPPTSSVNVLDPSLVVGSLLESIEEFVNHEEIEAEWKRWRECTSEEWLKGADELAQDYVDVLDMVKDHLAEKVMAFARMVTSVEERQTKLNRNIETIHRKGDVVRDNISRLGLKK